MGKSGKIRQWTLQKRARTHKTQRAIVQEKNENLIGSPNIIETGKSSTKEEVGPIIRQSAVWNISELYKRRGVEEKTDCSKTGIIKKNEGYSSKRGQQKEEERKKEVRLVRQTNGWKNTGRIVVIETRDWIKERKRKIKIKIGERIKRDESEEKKAGFEGREIRGIFMVIQEIRQQS